MNRLEGRVRIDATAATWTLLTGASDPPPLNSPDLSREARANTKRHTTTAIACTTQGGSLKAGGLGDGPGCGLKGGHTRSPGLICHPQAALEAATRHGRWLHAIALAIAPGTSREGCYTGTREGRLLDSQDEVGGWPELKRKPAPKDLDRDGMADAWELAHNLDPKDPEDRNGGKDKDGYTNLEEYLNGLCPQPGE